MSHHTKTSFSESIVGRTPSPRCDWLWTSMISYTFSELSMISIRPDWVDWRYIWVCTGLLVIMRQGQFSQFEMAGIVGVRFSHSAIVMVKNPWTDRLAKGGASICKTQDLNLSYSHHSNCHEIWIGTAGRHDIWTSAITHFCETSLGLTKKLLIRSNSALSSGKSASRPVHPHPSLSMAIPINAPNTLSLIIAAIIHWTCWTRLPTTMLMFSVGIPEMKLVPSQDSWY